MLYWFKSYIDFAEWVDFASVFYSVLQIRPNAIQQGIFQGFINLWQSKTTVHMSYIPIETIARQLRTHAQGVALHRPATGLE